MLDDIPKEERPFFVLFCVVFYFSLLVMASFLMPLLVAVCVCVLVAAITDGIARGGKR